MIDFIKEFLFNPRITSKSKQFYSALDYPQEQPPRGVLRKMCSENMQQIYRRTPMPKCNFNKVAKQLY